MSATEAGLPVAFTRTEVADGVFGHIQPDGTWMISLVNTHHHVDHTAGNGLCAGATIVAHENARAAMRTAGLPRDSGRWTDIDYGDLGLALPFLTFTDPLTLWADDLRCELRSGGAPAHTTNDSVLWIPARSVLFTGDH